VTAAPPAFTATHCEALARAGPAPATPPSLCSTGPSLPLPGLGCPSLQVSSLQASSLQLPFLQGTSLQPPLLQGLPFPGEHPGVCSGYQGIPNGAPMHGLGSRPCSHCCSSPPGSDTGVPPVQHEGQPCSAAPSLYPSSPCLGSLGIPGQGQWPQGVPAVHQAWAMGAMWALSAVYGEGPFPIPIPCPTGPSADATGAAGAAHWICCPCCRTVCTSNDLCWDAHMGADGAAGQGCKATAESWEVEPLGLTLAEGRGSRGGAHDTHRDTESGCGSDSDS